MWDGGMVFIRFLRARIAVLHMAEMCQDKKGYSEYGARDGKSSVLYPDVLLLHYILHFS